MDQCAALRTAIVAASLPCGDRVRWVRANSRDSWPLLLLTSIGGKAPQTLAGETGLARWRVQADHYGLRLEQLFDQARGLRRLMAATYGAQLDAEDMPDEDEKIGGEPLRRVRQDFVFWVSDRWEAP